MIYELEPSQYERARPLFGDLADCHLCISATLDGNNPGRLFVDDAEAPQAVFLLAVEGTFLGGNPTRFNADLRDHLRQTLPDIYAFYVDCHPKSWIEHLPEIFPQPPIPLARHHYICTKLAFDPPVPGEYEVRRIDQTLLDTPGLVIPDHIREWAVNNWGSIPAFLDRGFGFCTVHGDQVASWSLADCVSGTACEIGIQTRPDYRKRGLAALTVSAMVKYALAFGFKSVGWHCNENNLGSIGVATKVGFHKERDYLYYECIRHEAHYLAAIAYRYSQNGDHVAAADGYKRACASPDQPPWSSWYWFLTALSLCHIGQYQDAMMYLQGAVERGYDDLETILDEDEFKPLHKYPAWTELLQRLNA